MNVLNFIDFCSMNVPVISLLASFGEVIRIFLLGVMLSTPLLFFCRKLLSENKHVKYLHIPYTDAVVVVRCNPVSKWGNPLKFKPKYTQDEAIQHVRDLYRESLQKYRCSYSILLIL